MKDDNLVAELLLRLKEPGSHLSSRLNKGMTAAAEAPSVALPPPEWGMRHPRSKAAASKKEGHSTRRSPTTPLSWSGGGASPSDEYEECSLPSDPFPDVRSTEDAGMGDLVITSQRRACGRQWWLAPFRVGRGVARSRGRFFTGKLPHPSHLHLDLAFSVFDWRYTVRWGPNDGTLWVAWPLCRPERGWLPVVGGSGASVSFCGLDVNRWMSAAWGAGWPGQFGGGTGNGPVTNVYICYVAAEAVSVVAAAAAAGLGIGTNETVDTANKRSRRKKTFAELKEEESSLLKEQSYLKRELATLRVTLKEQRSLNHSLKRMKNDQDAESGAAKSSATLNQHDAVAPNSASSTCLSLIEEASSTLEGTPSIVPQQHIMQNVEGQDQDQAAFILPDLNVMPEDDFGSEARL
ncbi:hypothetical protein Dimus_019397 [Dionaea muscipula]